jgi:pyruvate/2-oxoglutarate dehydrogenase complex dihydrolipoamide acyltransferase (E2) component
VDPIQAKQAEVDDLVRRLADIHAREASLFAAKRRIPKATTALRQMTEARLEQAETTLGILKRNRAAAAGTGLLAAPVAPAPAPAPAPAVAAPEMADGGIPEAPAAPAAPQTFAESAEAVRAIQEARTPNPFIVQAYRDSVEPPVAPENVAAVPAPVSALPPAPGATKLFGPLPGAQVGVSPGFAAAAAEGTRRAKRAQETRKTVRRPLTEVPVLPLTPTAARAMVSAPIAEDALKFSRENPMAKGHMTLKKRLKDAPARLTKTQYDALDADMKPHFTKDERKFPGLPDMYSRNAKRVINPEGGMRKRTLKNRRGLNKRKNVRGSRRR